MRNTQASSWLPVWQAKGERFSSEMLPVFGAAFWIFGRGSVADPSIGCSFGVRLIGCLDSDERSCSSRNWGCR